LYLLIPISGVCVNFYLDLDRLGTIAHKIEIIERVDDLSKSFLDARRFEKNILLFAEESNVPMFRRYIADFSQLILSLKDEISASAGSWSFDALAVDAAAYARGMDGIIDMRIERAGVVDELRLSGRIIEKTLTDRLLAMELRRHEKNFIIYGEPTTVEKFHAALKEAAGKQHSLKRYSTKRPSLKRPSDASRDNRYENLFVQYGAIFDSLVDNAASTRPALKEVRAIARNIEKTIDTISDRERGDVGRLLTNVKVSIILSGVFLIVVLSAAGYLIARDIIGVFKKMERALENLVRDDFQSTVMDVSGTAEIDDFVETYNQAVKRLKGVRSELTNHVNVLEGLNAEILDQQQKLVETQRESAMRLLASEIAHEINNPMSSVTTLLLLFKEELPPEDPRMELIELMIRDNLRCHDVLNELVSFARNQPLKMKPVDFKILIWEAVGVVTRMADEIRIDMEDKEVGFKIDLGGFSGIKILLDPVLMHQALVNILLNAWHFSPHGGRIFLKGAVEDGEVIITVRDEGPGISEDVINRIFEPFFSTRKEQGGQGIGLSITRKIVERHLGGVTAQNAEGGGCVFTVRIPAVSFPGHAG
jgi:signal transduction histidine kinase